jgi:hypothetical protein
MVGMDTATYLFGTICGRSGMGKTETALKQFLHVALIEGDGCLFFDPHADANTQRLPPYLTEPDRQRSQPPRRSRPRARTLRHAHRARGDHGRQPSDDRSDGARRHAV